MDCTVADIHVQVFEYLFPTFEGIYVGVELLWLPDVKTDSLEKTLVLGKTVRAREGSDRG